MSWSPFLPEKPKCEACVDEAYINACTRNSREICRILFSFFKKKIVWSLQHFIPLCLHHSSIDCEKYGKKLFAKFNILEELRVCVIKLIPGSDVHFHVCRIFLGCKVGLINRSQFHKKLWTSSFMGNTTKEKKLYFPI